MRSILSFFSFHGRWRRTSYGLFILATLPVFGILCASFSVATLHVFGDQMQEARTDPSFREFLAALHRIPHGLAVGVFAISCAAFLVLVVAWVAFSVRRLHDMNATGWITLVFIPLNLIFPVIGYGLIALVLGLWPGTKGANGYGRDPRSQSDISDVFGSATSKAGPPPITA